MNLAGWVMIMVTSFSAVAPNAALADHSRNWLTLAAEGKDEQAADELDVLASKLKGESSEDLSIMLKDLSKALRGHCEACEEKEKLILFRGISNLENIGTAERPFLVSRALRDARGNPLPNKVLKLRDSDALDMIGDHTSWSKDNHSPLISTSVNPWTAGLFARDEKIAVLKICANRVYHMGLGSEYEVLLPLLIHTSEIVAIVEPGEGENPISAGKFKVLYKASKTMSKAKAAEDVQRYAKLGGRMTKGNTFSKRYNHFLQSRLNSIAKREKKNGTAFSDVEEEEKTPSPSDQKLWKLMKTDEGREEVAEGFLKDSHSAETSIGAKLMERLFMQKRPNAYALEALAQPHWLRHARAPVWVARAIKSYGCIGITFELFGKEFARHSEAPALLVGYIKMAPKDGSFDSNLIGYILSKSWWSKHPELKRWCGGKKPTPQCLREVNLREKTCEKKLLR